MYSMLPTFRDDAMKHKPLWYLCEIDVQNIKLHNGTADKRTVKDLCNPFPVTPLILRHK